MTKLDKPSLRIIKRAADAKENTATEGVQAKEVDRDGNKVGRFFSFHQFPFRYAWNWKYDLTLLKIEMFLNSSWFRAIFSRKFARKSHRNPMGRLNHRLNLLTLLRLRYELNLQKSNYMILQAVEEAQPAPPPAENVWAKRKEERESQERNMVSRWVFELFWFQIKYS